MATTFTSSTRLKNVRGLGSAGHGVGHWWAQRLTAVSNLALLVWLGVSLLMLPRLSHPVMLAWVAQPHVAVPLMLLVISTFWHQRLGVQVMIEDYVSAQGPRILALAALNAWTVAGAALALFSILMIAFGVARG